MAVKPGRVALAIAAGFVLLNGVLVTRLAKAPGIVEAAGAIIGGVFVWPLVFFGIAAIWKRNRSLRRAVLVFNIVSGLVVVSVLMQAGGRNGNGSGGTVAAKTSGTLAAADLQRLKRSVAYVVAGTGSKARSGTGFLVGTDGSTGLIVTNAHVVRAEKRGPAPAVELVFDSGEAGELRLDAEVAALDESADLAILKVTSDDLPPVIPITPTQEFALTQDVLILGFPFGDALASNGDMPSITVAKGTVSSNRRDVNGQIGVVQIDGDLNPGNSGGPIVTSAGELVGVARAEVRATNIGFAIPAREITALLRGRIAGMRSSKFGSTATVAAAKADPLGEIAEASFRVVEAEAEAVDRARREDGTWGPVDGPLHSYPFEPREYGDLVARIDYAPLASGYSVRHYIGQVGLKRTDGSFAYQAPFRIMVEDTGHAFYMGGSGVMRDDTERYVRRSERDKPAREARSRAGS